MTIVKAAPVPGILLLVAGLTLACFPDRESGRRIRPNVLLLVVDTLRADHLGSYGSHRELTPNLDRFAASTAVFRNTVAQGPNTINSAPCILTSVYLGEHGYTNYKLAISGEHLSLAEILADDGYETFAVSTNPHVTARHGLAQGFDTFIDNTTWTDTDAHTVNKIFFDWLAERSSEAPFFAMLWYIDPHVPYDPPREKVDKYVPSELHSLVDMRTKRPGFKKLSEEEMLVTKALYQGEINYFDDEFGRFVEKLENHGIFDDSMIVFTSDHGESFWEHSGADGRPVVGHGISLFREETAVPLLVKFPHRQLAGNVDTRVNSIDIAPTVVDFIGPVGTAKISERLRGRSLLPLLNGRDRDADTAYSVSELMTDFRGSVNIRMQSIETAEGKIIVTYKYRKKSYDPPLVQLVDVLNREAEIPAESGPARTTKDALLRKLRKWEAGLKPIPPRGIMPGLRDDELRKRLEALGYLN